MEDYSKRCRVCLSIEDNENFTSIYQAKDIALKLFYCTQIKIIEFRSEGLPALICKNCLEELIIADNFKSKALRSELILKESLKSKHLKIIEQINDSKSSKSKELIKIEPNDGTFELIENIETILANEYSAFENVNITYYNENENPRQSTAEKRKRPKRGTEANDDKNPIGTNELNSFVCKYCVKTFKHETYLRRHLTRVHHVENEKHRIKGTKNELSTIKHDDNTLYCEICQQFFTTRGSLQKHMKVKHEYVDVKDRYVCDYCGDDFVIKYYLIRHIRVRHLKTQIEKRAADSPIPCEVCGKILRNRGLLKPHMRSHQVMTPNDYWYCDLCPRKFKTRGGCTWHIHQRHVLKATFKCPYANCTVVYKGKWELKCHIKSKHTNQRDFRCEICGKGFLDRQKLQIHTRIHTGERPHACHICTATFIHQTDLRRHIWGHTGERPIRCEVPNCGKGFMKKSELLNHTNRCHASPAINFNTQQYAL